MVAFRCKGGLPPSIAITREPSASPRLDRGLLFGPLDGTTFHAIYFLPQGGDPLATSDGQRAETLAWSADGHEIVYGKDGTIYNLQQATSRPIATGSNPLWSPDGQWISYRGPNGEAMLIDPSGNRSRELLPGRKIVHALHWSPCGRYLLLSLVSQAGNLSWRNRMVYRLKDGALTAVGKTGPSVDDSADEWVITGPRH